MTVIFTAGSVFRDTPQMPVVVELHEESERRLAQNRRIRLWAFVALFAAMGAAWMWVAIRPDPKQQTVEVRP